MKDKTIYEVYKQTNKKNNKKKRQLLCKEMLILLKLYNPVKYKLLLCFKINNNI